MWRKFRYWKGCVLLALILSSYVLWGIIAKLQPEEAHNIVEILGTFGQRKRNINSDAIPPDLGSQSNASANGILHPPCKVIHIGMKVAHWAEVTDLVAILKQQLYYDHWSAFHFHLAASESAVNTLTTLLETWELDRVAVSFYPIAGPELHHSIPVILRALPASVHNIVFIACKMRFTKSISELWDAYVGTKAFQGEQFVGYVRSLRWMAKKDCVVCVHHLLLVNVQKARQIFPNLFSQNADVDTATSILERLTPDHVVQLPPSWYVELDSDFPFYAVASRDDLSAYRLRNLAGKFVDNVHVEAAKELNEEIDRMSGDLFGHKHHRCSAPGGQKVKPFLPVEDSCKEFRIEVQLSNRVHLYFMGSAPPVSDPYDVSMLTQFTIDRLEVLEQLASRWDGPLHALMYGDDKDAQKLVQRVMMSQVLSGRKNLAFHMVYKRRNYYPINFLRNVLLNVTTTPYLLFNDVDLVPSREMYGKIKKHIKQYLSNGDKLALVVPAFEQLQAGSQPPENRTQMLQEMKKRTVIGYRMNRAWNYGHRPVNYTVWKQTKDPYFIKSTPNFEPYVVLPSKTRPLYNGRLLERMGDKISYTQGLKSRGFRFLVLDDCFITHLPHPPSEGTLVWRSNKMYARCGSILNDEYKKELKAKYPANVSRHLLYHSNSS